MSPEKTDRRIGDPIAAGTVDASPQIDPFRTIRPMRAYGRGPLGVGYTPRRDGRRTRYRFSVS